MRVELSHLRSVPGLSGQQGYCISGARAWFARHDFDWRAFSRHGIDAEQLLATGDPLAVRLVEHAQQQGQG